jgi:antitoxin component of MazEF toxin-antitoxin module
MDTIMGLWIKKVYMSHNSLVVTLNKLMCAQLKITKGDYLVFEVGVGKKEATVVKFNRRKGDFHEPAINTSIENQELTSLTETRDRRRKDATACRKHPRRRIESTYNGNPGQ